MFLWELVEDYSGGDGLRHSFLPFFGLYEGQVVLVAHHRHLDGDGGYRRKNGGGQRALPGPHQRPGIPEYAPGGQAAGEYSLHAFLHCVRQYAAAGPDLDGGPSETVLRVVLIIVNALAVRVVDGEARGRRAVAVEVHGQRRPGVVGSARTVLVLHRLELGGFGHQYVKAFFLQYPFQPHRHLPVQPGLVGSAYVCQAAVKGVGVAGVHGNKAAARGGAVGRVGVGRQVGLDLGKSKFRPGIVQAVPVNGVGPGEEPANERDGYYYAEAFHVSLRGTDIDSLAHSPGSTRAKRRPFRPKIPRHDAVGVVWYTIFTSMAVKAVKR